MDLSTKIRTYFFTISTAIIICWLLKMLQFVFLPLVFATFITFFLKPVVAWLVKRKVPRFLSVIVVVVVSLLVIYLTGRMILTRLVAFQTEFPKYERQIEEMAQKAEMMSDLNIGPLTNERVEKELSKLSLSSIVGRSLNSLFSFIMYMLLTFVFAMYFLMGSAVLPEKIKRAFAPDQAQSINEAVDSIAGQIQRYIWAKTLTSIITGGMMIVVCFVFRIDFAITWGFFMVILNWLPTLGPLVGAVPPLLVVLINFGWVTAIWAMVVMLAVFLTLGNYIEPKMLGDSVNLSPLIALLALIFWGWLWGPAGMLVAVPLTSLLKFSCDHISGLRPIGILMGGKA